VHLVLSTRWEKNENFRCVTHQHFDEGKLTEKLPQISERTLLFGGSQIPPIFPSEVLGVNPVKVSLFPRQVSHGLALDELKTKYNPNHKQSARSAQ
jgi:hypothetical protein